MKFNNIFSHIILSIICIAIPFQNTHGQGSRYNGNYTRSGQVSYTGKSNIVIEGLEISNVSGSAITISNCENVIIRYNKISQVGLKPAVYVYNSKNVTIIDNSFENVQSGLVASKSQGIKFEYNDVLNVLGSLKGGSNIGVLVQFIEVTGAGNSISFNANENLPGQSSTEDIINLFNSNGTSQSPILVKGNWIRGGGPSTSGGGINLGDYGGSYQIAENNILVDPGQYGLGISGGDNMTLRNNKVYARRNNFTNVGITTCNWYESVSKSHTITVEKNAINYTNKDGNLNSWWFYKNMEPIAGKETNINNANLTASILPEQIIGRAGSSTPTVPVEPSPDEGSTPLPEEEEVAGEPEPEVEPDDNSGQVEIELPKINNHSSITIYLDGYNRVCVNNMGIIYPSATIFGANSKGEIIFQQSLTRYHTVLPNRPEPGNYIIYVKNGTREHLKTLYIR